MDDKGICRLCWRQAALLRWTKTGLTAVQANRNGQQLFLANLHQRGKRAKPATPYIKLPPRPQSPPRIVGHRQLALLDIPRDLRAGLTAGFPPPPDPQVAEFLLAGIGEHARQHGWSYSTLKCARRGIEILLALQDTPGAPIPVSVINQLSSIALPASQIRAFLDYYQLVEDDRPPATQVWLERQITGLPEPMQRELRLWSTVLWQGNDTTPRTRPRARTTVQIKLRWALPTLHAWAEQGIQSLAEITREDIKAVLPGTGNARYTAGAGLRSIFKVLKAHKVVFADPTTRLRLGAPEQRQPLPADLALIRKGLTSPDPTRAVMTALLAFHGLSPGQLRTLRLTDLRDGRLHLTGRTILLAEPVRVRLAAYLDYRNTRWPGTANPHLLIHYRTALSTAAVGTRWPALILGTAARNIRTDRILDEVHASGGDVRRICDLFGLSVKAAQRYTAVLEHPGLRTEAPNHHHGAPPALGFPPATPSEFVNP